MKKIYGTTRGALLALAMAATSILTMVGCGESATEAGYNNYGYGGYNNGYGYGYGTTYYPYNNRYLLMRSNGQETQYANVDQPLNSQSDVAKYHRTAEFQPMNRNQTIDQQNGYQNVNNNSDGMYFTQHNQQQYQQQDPYKSGQRQSTYWYYNYRYSCGGGYNVGYWGYRGACGYNSWNHIYAPYNYSWYNNWWWRPTYYNANNFWYYAPGWNNAYAYMGWNYYYFWIP